MTQDTQQEFGKWRSLLWPIYTFELKKFLPMFLMMFFISFNYTILRDTKDTLIVTATGSGAEAIPFLKVWGVVPCAILFMLVFSKLSNILTPEKLFYASLTPFLIFFGLFATVLYPNQDLLHPTHSADYLQSILPEGLGGLIAIFRNWTNSLFYIMAELWGSVVLSLLFWGFANEITKTSEAKRFYTRFGLGANVALLFSGPAIVYVSNIRGTITDPNIDAWQISLNYLMGMVVVSGIGVMLVYKWINSNILTDSKFYEKSEKKAKKSKPKMSLAESFKFLAQSKYILCLTLIVLSYGVAINLIEVSWKNQLKLQYPNANDYSTFMGYFSTFTGAVTIFMMLFVGGACLKKGWGFSAMITPVVLLITGTGFFSFILFGDALTGVVGLLGTTPLMLAVILGATQNIMSKSAKYSLFDPTKEMAYIPLDAESKVKGKAAIDVVGARLGKSGGSLIQQGLLVAFGSIAAFTPYVAAILFVIILGWLFAVISLNKSYTALVNEKEETKEVAAEEKTVEVGSQKPATA